MTVERASFISQLDEQNPKSFDMIKEGDDHIRLTKSTARNTFPRFDRKVEFSAEQLNKLYSWLMAVEDAADDPEALNKFTVLGDMEIRKDLYFTEGGEAGEDTITPESPKISGLSDIQFTTEEGTDPSLIPAEKLSRALNLRTADNRYIKSADQEGIVGGISKLTVEDGDTRKDVAVATDGILTVKGKVVANKIEDVKGTEFVADLDAGKLTVKEMQVGTDLRVTGNIFRGSDARLKFDIQDIADDITLDGVRPVSYRKMGRHEYGVIAQELPVEHQHMRQKDVFTDMYAVDYTQFIPVLIKEIQSLKKEIAVLKGAKPAI